MDLCLLLNISHEDRHTISHTTSFCDIMWHIFDLSPCDQSQFMTNFVIRAILRTEKKYICANTLVNILRM